LRTLEGRQAAADEQPVPARPVLLKQEDRLPGQSDTSTQTRRVYLHERQEAVDLRLVRGEFGQDAAQTERLFAKRWSDPVLARRCGIALVEDQIDHLEDGGEARHALGAARELEPDVRLGEGPLRADDPLGDRGDRDEESPRNLLSRQTSEDAKREGDPCVLREHRMAGHEDEAEEIVPDLLVDRSVHIKASLSPLDIASELFVLALERLAAPDQVDRAVLRGPHQPGARLLRNAGGRPLLERGDE